MGLDRSAMRLLAAIRMALCKLSASSAPTGSAAAAPLPRSLPAQRRKQLGGEGESLQRLRTNKPVAQVRAAPGACSRHAHWQQGQQGRRRSPCAGASAARSGLRARRGCWGPPSPARTSLPPPWTAHDTPMPPVRGCQILRPLRRGCPALPGALRGGPAPPARLAHQLAAKPLEQGYHVVALFVIFQAEYVLHDISEQRWEGWGVTTSGTAAPWAWAAIFCAPQSVSRQQDWKG